MVINNGLQKLISQLAMLASLDRLILDRIESR